MISRSKILNALFFRVDPSVFDLLLERDTPSLRAILHFYLTGNAESWQVNEVEHIKN